MKNILLYHKGCPDGFGSAYSFWKKYKNKMEYLAVNHTDPLDESVYKDKNVFMADICFSREIMLKIKSLAKSFQALDHHISAQEKLSDLDFCKFVQNKSGAMISWDYVFPNKPAPKIIHLIQDRDLFTWKIENAEEMLLALDCEEYSFEAWDKFEKRLRKSEKSLIKEGLAIKKFNKNLINRLMTKSYFLNIAGYTVPVVNVSFFQSDMLNLLSKDLDTFAAGYHFDGKRFVFSLRSAPNGMDVSKIANLFGGGGHKHASGFSVSSLEMLSEAK